MIDLGGKELGADRFIVVGWDEWVMLEDWLLSLMSTLVMGFEPQDWWSYLDMKENAHADTTPMDG